MTKATNGLGHPPKFTAKVTKDILADACKRNSNTCMVACALKEAKPKLSRIAVDIQTIRATDWKKGERYVWLTPRSIQQKIVDFDAGKDIKPFAFKMGDGQTIEVAPKTPKQKSKMRANNIKRKKAQLRMARDGNRTGVPVVVGGKAPPKAIGSRRAFGLRSLAY